MAEVKLGSNILGANELMARKNRTLFTKNGQLVINLMSSPGAGKTTLLERTIEACQGQVRIGIIEGDLYTDQDAQRIGAKGAPVVQINTEGACHLDAGMVERSLSAIGPEKLDLIVIENVGNLVCPAEFDLGEDFKTVVLSVAEGNDKPLKYPLIFRESSAIVLNKLDLVPYTDFDLERFRKDVKHLNPSARVFYVSARTGEGIAAWADWLLEEVQRKRTV
ncbi:MAG: hydrogenase nickel incorporation protein HypB [Solirubrobacterales bacterium]